MGRENLIDEFNSTNYSRVHDSSALPTGLPQSSIETLFRWASHLRCPCKNAISQMKIAQAFQMTGPNWKNPG